MIKKILIIFFLLTFWGCGYHLVGTGSFFEKVKTLYLTPFEKVESVYVLDQRLNESFRKELLRRKVVIASNKEEAEAIFYGSILSYSVFPISFGEDGRAEKYRVSLLIKVNIKGKDGKELFKIEGYRFEREYSRAQKLNKFLKEEIIALNQLADEVAREVVNAIFETEL